MPLDRIIEPAAQPMHAAEARDHVRQDDGDYDDARLNRAIRGARVFAENECNRSIVATRWRLTLDSFPGYGFGHVPYGRGYSHPGNMIILERGPVLAVRSVKYLDYGGQQITVDPAVYTTDLSGQLGRVMPRFGQVWQPALPQIGAVQIEYDAGDCAPITTDAATNVITIKGGVWKDLVVGDRLRFSNSGGELPAPLQPDTDYFVLTLPTPISFTLAATPGGAAIDITSAGSGLNFIGAVPDGLKTWLLLRVGGLYENAEDVARGSITPLPNVDCMLSEYQTILN